METLSIKNIFALTFVLFSFLFVNTEATACGKSGVVQERKADGSFGAKIPNATITFTSEDGTFTKTETSNTAGRYQASLPQGRYKVKVTAAGYEPYTTGNGFSVVTCAQPFQTFNIFMKKAVKCRVTGISTNNSNSSQTIVGAKLTFKSTTGTFVKRLTTGAGGRYNVHLPTGTYKVTATAQGFQPYTKTFTTSCKSPYQTFNILMIPVRTCLVKGQIADKQNMSNRLPNATVVFKAQNSNFEKTVRTNASGVYEVRLPNGSYRVEVSATGYNPGTFTFKTTCKSPFQQRNFFVTKKLEKCGFQGIVTKGGVKIANATIEFRSEDGSVTKTTRSKANGFYQIALPRGRYIVKVTAAGHAPHYVKGFFVVNCSKPYQTGNILIP